MKLEFGGLLRRLFFGGVRLLPIEQALMTAMVEALPPPLQHAVQQQLDAYNLVQREADGRALNFYRMLGRKASRDGIPPLPIQRGDVKLLRLTFTLAEHDASAQGAVGHGDVEEQAMRQADAKPTRDRASTYATFHATMYAIDQHLFCITFSHDLRQFRDQNELVVLEVKPTWRGAMLNQ